MNTDQLTPVVRRWLQNTEATPPDARRSARQVMARMPYVRQRSRWWPLPAFRRRPSSTPPASDREHRSEAIPVKSYRFPTVIGRTQTMFSPVKAVTAGALIFALGGLLLIAQPFEPRQGAAPAAEMTELPGVTVTVHQDCVDAGDLPDVCTWTASDPRLTGTASAQFTGDISDDRPGEGFRAGLSWLDIALEGTEGSWSGHEYVMWTEPFQHFIVVSGSGEYEGWHYLAMATTEAGPPIDWTGVIYEGELPPFGPLPTPTGD